MKIMVEDAQLQLDELVARVLQGEQIWIYSARGAVVEMRPVNATTMRQSQATDLLGVLKGEIQYEEGWDAPLSASEAKKHFADVNETETPGGSER